MSDGRNPPSVKAPGTHGVGSAPPAQQEQPSPHEEKRTAELNIPEPNGGDLDAELEATIADTWEKLVTLIKAASKE